MTNKQYSWKNILLYFTIILLVFGCTPTSKLKYIENKGADAHKNQFVNYRSEKTIQPYDYLFIRIYSLDEQTNNIFRERGSGTYNTEIISYEVDINGDINFPFVGNINVKNLTLNKAKEKIENSLSRYLNNVSIRVRFVNNKITILGEVNRPGHYSFYDEKVNVFQAIGFAHGVNTFGNKENITLVREKDNIIKYYYLDLTDKDIVASDFYYLLPNDIIIVNPINAKYRELRDYSLTLISTILSTTTALIALISIKY
jgi:polysaccharide export outer membrane protein